MHLEHFVHVSDAARVEVQRLVERLRELPSRKGGIRCEEVAEGRQPRMQRAREARLEFVGKAWVECTSNISSMVVTLDVSKLSGWLNSSACCRVERRHTMREVADGAVAAHAACKERLDWNPGAGYRRGAP